MYCLFFGILISKCFAAEGKKKEKKVYRSLSDRGFLCELVTKVFPRRRGKMALGFEILNSRYVSYGGATSLILPYFLHLF